MGGYYPVYCDLQGKPCTVVGGGQVAERKVQSLLECGARVTVVSPTLDTPRLREWCQQDLLALLPRSYRPGDVAGAFLVISATDQAEVNALVARDCRARGIIVNVVDAPELCDFIVPSVVRRGDLVISISTGGKSPLLARLLREELEERYGPEYGILADMLGEARRQLQSGVDEQVERREILLRILNAGLLDLIKSGNIPRAKERMQECISSPLG
ncbi:MAG: bifunctional precorrin-2 dehydrogenase/sirohydrochlorin ferrochelatase [Clostridia bacterium]|nr:MAG: bifunctional precorrin-2 dehydrogenase/sirohydrochlorin ferrochelatase [Clostridia bacterium]